MIKKIYLLIIFIFFIQSLGHAQAPPFCFEELDGSPSVCFPVPIKFSNGSITENVDGSITISTGAAISSGKYNNLENPDNTSGLDFGTFTNSFTTTIGDANFFTIDGSNDFIVQGDGDVTIGKDLSLGSITQDGTLIINDDDAGGDSTVTIQALDATGVSYILTLPPDDGDADEVLKTNGSGVLDWVAQSGGSSIWSSIGDPTADGSISMGNFNSIFNGGNWSNSWTSTLAGPFFTIDGVDGNTALAITDGNVVVTDGMTINGAVVFNEGAANVDIRMESAANTDMFFLDASANAICINCSDPIDTLTIQDGMDLRHTAAQNDDHAFEIDLDAAGFGDVKAVDIIYTTGAMSAGEEEAAILINIDESAATGGEIIALQVLSTEGSAEKVIGIEVREGIIPLEQFSGTFGAMDSALVNATNRLTEFLSSVSDIVMFVADNDTVTIGDAAKFDEIEFLLDTVASGSGIAPTFEFSTGVGTWTAFSPVDGTNGFRNTGIIAFDPATIPTWAVGTGTEFLIRITRTRNSLSTTPIEDKVQIALGVEYHWDADGSLLVKELTMEGLTDDANQQIIGTIDPSADRTFNFPNDEMVAGDVLVASDTSDLEYLNLATTQVLIGDGVGIPTAAALSGDVTMTNGGVVTVVDDSHAHVVGNIDSNTSANWAAQISDETGTGVFVLGTAPTFTTSITMGAAGLNEAELEILDGLTATTAELESLTDGSEVTIHSHDYDGIGDLDANNSLSFAGFTNIWTSTISNDSDFFTIQSGNVVVQGNLELPQGTATITSDCDVAGDAGRIFIDTNAPSGQQVYVCEGTTGWVLQGDGNSGGATAYDDIADPDANGSISHGAFTNTWTSTITNDNDFFIGSAGNYNLSTANLELPQGTVLIASDCDEASDAGRVFIDTDATSGSQHYICEGTAGWVLQGSAGGGTAMTEVWLPVQGAKIAGGTYVTDGDATQGAQIDGGESNWRLMFDATTDEAAVWGFRMPANYSSAPILKIGYTMNSGSSLEVEFEGAIMCVTDGDLVEINTPSFSTIAVGSATVLGIGRLDEISITLTDDSCAANDYVYVYLSTDADDAINDDATGDREVVYVTFTYTGS